MAQLGLHPVCVPLVEQLCSPHTPHFEALCYSCSPSAQPLLHTTFPEVPAILDSWGKGALVPEAE